MSIVSDYRKLIRLREKQARLQRHITFLERKLAGRRARWGQCAMGKNRR